MKSLKRKKIIVLCLLLVGLAVFSLPVAATAQEVNDVNIVEDPNLLAELQMPGRIEGTGTYFEVNDSNYLNITFESSEPVHLSLESVPEMVVADINAAEGAASTQLTLGGFDSSTTYYKYEDDYHNEVAFTTDGNGSYTYIQDLNEPHLVFIQPRASTIFLSHTGWSDPKVGTWDPHTQTGTLTTDVSETIQIDGKGITLDGAGHTVTGTGTGNGIYLSKKSTAITIKNVKVQQFSYGIYMGFSTGNTLTDNTCSNNTCGIRLYKRANDNTVTSNTANSNGKWGIYLYDSSNNTLTENNVSINDYGIYLHDNCNNNTLTENTCSNNNVAIFLYRDCSGNSITCNATSNNLFGIYLYDCDGNRLTGNTSSENNYDGMRLRASGKNILIGNTCSNNHRFGIYLHQSSHNKVYNNNFIDNESQVHSSSGNVFNLDKPTGGNYWNNWTGPDNDGDGFVDKAYEFRDGTDYLPLVNKVPSLCNQAPVADADGPYIALASSWDGAEVQLDGTGSYDPDGDALTYEWDLDLQYDSDFDGDPTNDMDAKGPTPISLFPIGQRHISLVVEDDQGARSEPDATTVTVSVIDVDIDIKPGSYPNSINLGSHGVVSVAFLTTPEFDALTVYPMTITLRGEDFEDGLVKLRGKKDAVPMANPEDVDGDGDLDLVVHLDTERLADYELQAIVTLGAKTQDGYVVQGSDTVHVVPE